MVRRALSLGVLTSAVIRNGSCDYTRCSRTDETIIPLPHAEPAAIAADAAQVGEFVEMLQTGIKRLESSHRQTRHGPVFAPWTLLLR